MAGKHLSVEDWYALNPKLGRQMELDALFLEHVQGMDLTDTTSEPKERRVLRGILREMVSYPVSDDVLDREIEDAKQWLECPDEVADRELSSTKFIASTTS